MYITGCAASLHTGWTFGRRAHTYIAVDNRMKVDVGMNAHSVSDHTQTNWNGVIGDLSLRVRPTLYIDHVRLDRSWAEQQPAAATMR